jgi:hypothetical protein
MDLHELPGGDLILAGLNDLGNGETKTVGALLIAMAKPSKGIASTRLTQAGLAFPKTHLAPEPELALYDRLQRERSDAYPYYNALLASLNSFCNALELRDRSKT